jgi:hypothetical protein
MELAAERAHAVPDAGQATIGLQPSATGTLVGDADPQAAVGAAQLHAYP